MDLTAAHHDGPPHEAAAQKLAKRGLTLCQMDNEGEEFSQWFTAVTRGFLAGEPRDVDRDATQERHIYRRLIGVLDAASPQPEIPVGTFASWMSELSLPGRAVIPAFTISDVTVAPTHRRRGIARSMMEGELRRAADLGIPMAALTVTEAGIYGRYGFAAAVTVARWIIDVKRAGWIGPSVEGRVDFISRERWRELAPALFDEVRPSRPGELTMPHGYWDRFAGTRPDVEKPGDRRAVQFTDAEGTVRGLGLYKITPNENDFTRSHFEVVSLIAADDDAAAGLWRFFLEHDLIGTIRMNEVGLEEPLRWMIADQKAAEITLFDHHYLRILDVPAVLAARKYAAPGSFILDVVDPLHIAGGSFLVDIDVDGTGRVEPTPADWVAADAPDTVPVRLGVGELSALCVGQVSALTLAAAGRIKTTDASAFARSFGWHEPARLSFVY